MRVKQLLFPASSRLFPGQRWVNISLRTLHLIGLVGIGAGYIYPVAGAIPHGYMYLTIASGAALVLISLWSNAIWLMQLRGQAVLVKVLLLAAILIWPAQGGWLLLVIIIISGYISHAPGDVRYYSIYHRRRIEGL